MITADGSDKANYNGAIIYATDIEGKVTKINDQFFEITLGNNVKVKIQKAAISNVLPKGTINSI